jgi:Family of unknown function (DUF6499)
MTHIVSDANWQNVVSYSPLLQMDRSLLMWEWLRRNPDYRDFYIGKTRDVSKTASGVQISCLTDGAVVQPWGLLFRRGSGPVGE